VIARPSSVEDRISGLCGLQSRCSRFQASIAKGQCCNSADPVAWRAGRAAPRRTHLPNLHLDAGKLIDRLCGRDHVVQSIDCLTGVQRHAVDGSIPHPVSGNEGENSGMPGRWRAASTPSAEGGTTRCTSSSALQCSGERAGRHHPDRSQGTRRGHRTGQLATGNSPGHPRQHQRTIESKPVKKVKGHAPPHSQTLPLAGYWSAVAESCRCKKPGHAGTKTA